MAKKRIAFVNQRYGLEVNGGSEYYTRLIAERLTKDYEVEVLTSTALSYETWKNYYTRKKERINGVTVRRFHVRRERGKFSMRLLGKLISGPFRLNRKRICDLWVRQQGPQVPGLVEYIRKNKEAYTAIIFVTYLYYPTVFGMPEARDRAIFIPTAHDEPYIHFQSHAQLFSMPKAIIYLTDEEKKLVNSLYHNERIPSIVAGVGVDVPENVDQDAFRKKYDIQGDYLIYAGRVDISKGCDEMFSFFQRFRKEEDTELTLVIMGQKFMDVPEEPHVKYLGFVSEEDKFNGIAGAKALWLPSPFESLSISVLEAMALRIPVLVNGKCEVLRGHCEKSGGGLFYMDYDSCKEALCQIVHDPIIQRKMGLRAEKYIQEHYLWDEILKNIESLIESMDAEKAGLKVLSNEHA